MKEIIKSLSDLSEQEIYEAFAEAFVDYELQLNKKQLQAMLYRRGWVPELSFGAINKGRLVSFTLNGIGMFNGKKLSQQVLISKTKCITSKKKKMFPSKNQQKTASNYQDYLKTSQQQ